jgi:hypothetical protein
MTQSTKAPDSRRPRLSPELTKRIAIHADLNGTKPNQLINEILVDFFQRADRIDALEVTVLERLNKITRGLTSISKQNRNLESLVTEYIKLYLPRMKPLPKAGPERDAFKAEQQRLFGIFKQIVKQKQTPSMREKLDGE